MNKPRNKPEVGTGDRKLDKLHLNLLKEIGSAYAGAITLSELSANTGIHIAVTTDRVIDLESDRLVEKINNGYKLTPAGVQKVLESNDSEITKSA